MKPKVTTVAIAIGLFGALAASGQIFAASAMPASGEGPLFAERDVATSSLTRAQVHAGAVQSPPPSGEQQFAYRTLQTTTSTLTRAQVHAGAVQSPPAGGEQGDWMGMPASRRGERAARSDTLALDPRPIVSDEG